MFLGLRTVIYPAPDLPAAKAWFTSILGIEPYFDQPFYVGYDVGGYELGLDPGADPDEGPLAMWGVGDIDAAVAALVAAGATVHAPVTEVGDGIRVASVQQPIGSILGIIENPHFTLPATPTHGGGGPGR